MRSILRWYIWSFFLFLIATIVVSFPLLKNPSRNVVDDYDGIFIAWSLNWASYAVTHEPLKFFDAPIFYPLTKTFTFSDPMLTAGLLATPFLVMTHEPLIANTAVIFISYLLFGWFTALFIHKATQSKILAIGVGMYATFGSYHTMYMGHLHTFMLQWIPLSLLAWSLYREKKHIRWIWVWVVSCILTAINSPFSGFLFLAAQGVWFFDPKTKELLIRTWKTLIAPVCTAFFFVLLFYVPYFQSSSMYHSERSIRDAAHFALSLNEVVGSQRGLSYGVIFCVVILLVKKQKSPLKKGAFVIGSVALLLSLGPVLKWNQSTVKIPFPIPLPYSVAYYVVPGMKAFRAPARWVVLAPFLFILGAALSLKHKDYSLFVFLLFILLAIEKPWNYQVFTLHAQSERAPVYTWLEQHQHNPVVFFPPTIYDMPSGARKEVQRMLDTLPGNQVLPLFNGYSGFAPRERIDALITLNTTFLSQESMTILQRANIYTLVIEKNAYTTEQIDGAKRLLTPRYEDDQTLVGEVPASN